MSATSRSNPRFVPVSETDFNQYAKNLAWLTGFGLSQAKETLADLYGFPSYYEMRKILEQGTLPPGPFSVSPIPSFMPEEKSSQPNSQDWLQSNSAEYRLRRKKVFDLGDDEKMSPLRRVALVEVGLFCTPKLHKSLFKTAKEGILAIESKDLDKHKEFLYHHWPVGFWGMLEVFYHKRRKTPSNSVGGAATWRQSRPDWAGISGAGRSPAIKMIDIRNQVE